MGLWDVIKRSFQRETTKAAVKASAAAVANAAEQAADGLLSEAEKELAAAEKSRADQDDGMVLPEMSASDPAWLADVRKTEAEVQAGGSGAVDEPGGAVQQSAEDRAKAELAALKAQLLHVEE